MGTTEGGWGWGFAGRGRLGGTQAWAGAGAVYVSLCKLEDEVSSIQRDKRKSSNRLASQPPDGAGGSVNWSTLQGNSPAIVEI